MIEIKNVNFSYQKNEQIIRDFSLTIPKGSIFGFLGPNGAGKTTIIRLVLNLLSPQNGSVRIDGRVIDRNSIEALAKIGSLIEQPSLYNHLTGKENLELLCVYYKVNSDIIPETLKKVNLLDAANKKVKKYSQGMKQRLGIASCLLHNPELIILDEPMNGLDPQGIAEVRDIILGLNKEFGTTVFYSSHILSEIENTCTDIAIINKGVNIFSGKIVELRNKISNKNTIQFECSDINKANKIIEEKFHIVSKINGSFLLFDIPKQDIVANIIKEMVNQNIQIYEVKKLENSLEKLFLQLTQSTQSK